MASENKNKMAGEDFATRLRSLITRFGFRPDEVNVSSQFGVGTISFKNQKGKATELVSKLRGAMKQMGVPEAAITAREVQYPADADGPAEHWGVVNVDFNKMPHAKFGKKDTMAVEDRFYFGKGWKERFEMWTVWEFRSVDGKQIKRVLRRSEPNEQRYQHEYQRILYRGDDLAKAKSISD